MKKLALVALLVASSAGAQNLRTLTRSTSTTGANDSALTLVNDSASRSRAASFAQVRKVMSLKAFDSLVTAGVLRLTGATVAGAPTWSSKQTFATGQKVDTATWAQTLTTARALWGQSFDGSAAITGSLTSVGNITGGASSMTITPGTGNSRTLTLQSTTSAGTAKNTLVLGADSSSTFLGILAPAATASRDLGTSVLKWRNIYLSGAVLGAEFDVNSGNGDFMAQSGAGHVTFSTGGVANFDISGGASAVLSGGAGNMSIVAGTGNSRTLALRTTTSGGTATTALTLNADQSSTFAARINAGADILAGNGSAASPAYAFANASISDGMYRAANDSLGLSAGGSAFLKGLKDTLIINSKAKAIALTAASGTPNALCLDATTKQMLENAALTCTVSSARYKKDIRALTNAEADHIVFGLKPKSFTYKDGGRKSIHVIAEQADSVDKRIPTYDAQGRPNSVDDAVILTALLQVVQRQHKTMDSLLAVLRKR